MRRDSSSKRRPRAFTLAEMLTVSVLLALFLTTIAAILPPLIRGPGSAQAKVDTIQAAAQSLYQLQRDIRQAKATYVWICTDDATPSCSQPAVLSAVQILVVPTAYDASGQFRVVSAGGVGDIGKPDWQGAVVYRLTVSTLQRSVVLGASYVPSTNGAAAAAATAAIVAPAPGAIARNIQSLGAAVTPSNHVVSLQLAASASEGGSANRTVYRSDVLTRNN